MAIGFKLTASLEHWLAVNEPEAFVLISFGHVELFTDEMKQRTPSRKTDDLKELQRTKMSSANGRTV